MEELGADRLRRLHLEFRVLKRGEGLSPNKLAGCSEILGLLREVEPIRAAQRLLDDLEHLGGADGLALQWALGVVPGIPMSNKLDHRRSASGVPESTAKDRELRAINALVAMWSKESEEWASSVFRIDVEVFPIRTSIQFGSLEVLSLVSDIPSEQQLVIGLEVRNNTASEDFLTVANSSSGSLVVYGQKGAKWRLQIQAPPFPYEHVWIERVHVGLTPSLLRLERTDPDGAVVAESISGLHLREGRTLLKLSAAALSVPVPVIWNWPFGS